MYLFALSELPEAHRRRFEFERRNDDEYPEYWLHFGSNLSGDTYAFEIKGEAPSDDAPVLLIDHEVGAEARRFPTLADFLRWTFDGD